MEKMLIKQLEEQRHKYDLLKSERDMYLERLNNLVDESDVHQKTIDEAWGFMSRALNEKQEMLLVAYDLLVERISAAIVNLNLDESSEEDRYVMIEEFLEGLPQELVDKFNENHPNIVRPVEVEEDEDETEDEELTIEDEPTTEDEPVEADPVGEDNEVEPLTH